jgi:hypothetical protein
MTSRCSRSTVVRRSGICSTWASYASALTPTACGCFRRPCAWRTPRCLRKSVPMQGQRYWKQVQLQLQQRQQHLRHCPENSAARLQTAANYLHSLAAVVTSSGSMAGTVMRSCIHFCGSRSSLLSLLRFLLVVNFCSCIRFASFLLASSTLHALPPFCLYHIRIARARYL